MQLDRDGNWHLSSDVVFLFLFLLFFCHQSREQICSVTFTCREVAKPPNFSVSGTFWSLWKESKDHLSELARWFGWSTIQDSYAALGACGMCEQGV